jgi:glucose-1-phosphatase
VTGKIKLVLFDMDNVLCDYDRGKRVAHLAGLARSTSERVDKAIWESGFGSDAYSMIVIVFMARQSA